jgi:predicted DNA-binding transcriptional regulator YafY
MLDLMDELEVSRATIKRDLEYLRDRMEAPIVWDREANGYRLEAGKGEGFDLPGVWFNSSELHALLTMDHLLSNLQPGLLAPHIAPLRERITKLLDSSAAEAEEVLKRVKLVGAGFRPVEPAHFARVADGLLRRRRLRLGHYNRASHETTERLVSPQRITHYRGNWYLDTWCHVRDGIRRFAMDAISSVEVLDDAAIDVDTETLTAELDGGYGAFIGKAESRAVLIFTPLVAHWVASEVWHSEQKGEVLPDGSYRLELPYSHSQELLMDILKYGSNVKVKSPPELRQRLVEEARGILQNHALT